MLLEPGERTTTEEQQRERIRGVLRNENQTILLMERAGTLVGYVSGLGGRCRRNRHCARVVLGVLQEFSGQGYGKALLRGLEEWARARSVSRLELTVMVHNARAIGLYKGMGFLEEGTKRRSLLIDGRPVDELYMAKLLEP